MQSCFVVMAFNRKTDYQSGRTLDMDKSYRLLIKPVVQECGLECVRADEIVHTGVIDVPMYQKLLDADVVIADLSTANPNAMYELGVRHALRPFSTVVIAESKLQYPFNVAHTAIRSYQHLGDAIDYEEVLRFRGELKDAIQTVLAKQEKDSPVYTYLPGLRPPSLSGGRGVGRGSVTRSAAAAAGPQGPSMAAMMEQANAAMEREDFATARSLFRDAHAARRPDQPWTANDDYVVQQLALSTLRGRNAGDVDALVDAQRLLGILKPSVSQDPTTVLLAGSLSKELWQETEQRSHLEDAVAAHERAFCLRPNAGVGITLALMLNIRAAQSPAAEAIADFVHAQRLRRQVLTLCDEALAAERSVSAAATDAAARSQLEFKYRLRATLAEAHLGLGNVAEGTRWQEEAFRLAVPAEWKESTALQLRVLTVLLEKSPLRFIAQTT